MIVVIFKSRVREENQEEYYRQAEKMVELAKGMPGFISYKTFAAPDGERLTINEWESESHLKAWRDHPEHKMVQQMGRDDFYQDYTLQVCEPLRESRFSLDAG